MKKLIGIVIASVVMLLAFSGSAAGWHVNSDCRDVQWVLSIPNEDWANGTTGTFDFDQGPTATAGKGQSVVAPANATSVQVTFSNSEEYFNFNRPEGCKMVTPTTTTTTTTTTTLPPAVDIPPVPTTTTTVFVPPPSDISPVINEPAFPQVLPETR